VIVLRPALQEDQRVITQLIHTERLNPLDLNWQRFIVAEEDRCTVGVIQARMHPDGSRELASLVVVPSHRQRGIASMLVGAVQEQWGAPLYLTCVHTREPLYNRYGFTRCPRHKMPPLLRVEHAISNIALHLFSRPERILVLVWK
jgi:amino-acid N-acetyltransferase